jgi:predicted Zn finger-like uncharacterized protein
MVIVCSGCKNQITVDEATLPTGVFKIRCTGCGRVITSQRSADPVAATPPPPAPAPPPLMEKPNAAAEAPSPSTVNESFVKNHIANSKKEILEAMQALFRGAKTSDDGETDAEELLTKRALICSSDQPMAQALNSSLQRMGYQCDVAASAAESFKKLDSLYSIVVIDPSFPDDTDGGRKLIGRVNGRKATDRRQMFLILLSSTQKTLDGNSAFLNGVNLILNKSDLNYLESSIKKCQKEFQQFYSTFRRVSGEV